MFKHEEKSEMKKLSSNLQKILNNWIVLLMENNERIPNIKKLKEEIEKWKKIGIKNWEKFQHSKNSQK